MIKVSNKIQKLKINKYYKLTYDTALFTNNIYRINYKGLNQVLFEEFCLSPFHHEYFENFWKNYKNKLVFASGLYSLKTKRLLIYHMELWHRFIKKGDLNSDLIKRMVFSFDLEIPNDSFNIIEKISHNNFLVNRDHYINKKV